MKVLTKGLISHSLKQFGSLNTDESFEKLIEAVRRMEDIKNTSFCEIRRPIVPVPDFVFVAFAFLLLIILRKLLTAFIITAFYKIIFGPGGTLVNNPQLH